MRPMIPLCHIVPTRETGRLKLTMMETLQEASGTELPQGSARSLETGGWAAAHQEEAVTCLRRVLTYSGYNTHLLECWLTEEIPVYQLILVTTLTC
ncbi:hypothetical protein RRG08_023064 [Elysia crispata]|uniref:Uncharacterized protein n=1 Tax=Elysia crispata TaxID=231223 RepID=A0AAE1AUG8_9GAST|nr:hypothetical protein RRG08_023064 [Elysia crispata]